MLFSLIPGGFGNRERVIGWFSTRLSSVCDGGLVEAWRTVRSAVRGGALCGPWPEGVWAGPARPSPLRLPKCSCDAAASSVAGAGAHIGRAPHAEDAGRSGQPETSLPRETWPAASDTRSLPRAGSSLAL